METDVASTGWVAVLPVKRLTMAKTRLRGAVPGIPHDRLVLAMAADTLAAVLASPLVRRALAVTDDPDVTSTLAGLGAERVPDDGGTGLNAALARGAALAAGSPVVALTADLPALRPAELTAALTALAGDTRGFVPDAAGTGTVLLAAPAGAGLDPHFGPGSASAHAASGAVRLTGDWPSLRRDVDTAADLAAATALGLGRHTAELVGADRRYRVLRGDELGGGGVQGTVATFDERTGAGSVLLDDGAEVTFPGAAFAASGLRLLRIGQRVRLDRDDTGQISRVTLPTFP
jgi:2-phospho-L-lactate/phosphoenolpyruvate guanylyltransferase